MRKSIIYWLLCSIITLTSCDKWLDIEPKGKIILTNAEEYAQLFDNSTYIAYNITDIAYLDDESMISPQNVLDALNSPSMGSANATFNAEFDRAEYAYANSGSTSSTFYQTMYQRIAKICNTITVNQNEIKGSESEIAVLVAQAKAYRAFNYFMLVNIYAKPYNAATAATDGGIPVRVDIDMESQAKKPKSSVEEVYQQIEQDLNEAIPDLPETSKTPYRFNKAAGYALKAKVHLFKKEWDECIRAAEQSYALNHATYDLVSRIDAKAHKPIPAIYATGEENLFFATFSTDYYMHPELVSLYKKGLVDYGQSEEVYDMRLDLYKQPRSSVKDYQYTLDYQPSALEYSKNSIGLRTTEVMLMLAECYARKGQTDKMTEYLEPYLISRYANYNPSALRPFTTHTDAVKFVLRERRKELTMGCNRFFDLRRLNTETDYQTTPTRTIPMDTEATPNLPQQTYTLPVNSPLYVLPFPSKVIANDPRLTSNSMSD